MMKFMPKTPDPKKPVPDIPENTEPRRTPPAPDTQLAERLSWIHSPSEILKRMYAVSFGLLLFGSILSGISRSGSRYEVSLGPPAMESYGETLPVSEVIKVDEVTLTQNAQGNIFAGITFDKFNTSTVYEGGSVTVNLMADGTAIDSTSLWVPWLNPETTEYSAGAIFYAFDLEDTDYEVSQLSAEVFFDESTVEKMESGLPVYSYTTEILEDGVSSQSGVVVYKVLPDKAHKDILLSLSPVIEFYKDSKLIYAEQQYIDLSEAEPEGSAGYRERYVCYEELPDYDEVRILPLSD